MRITLETVAVLCDFCASCIKSSFLFCRKITRMETEKVIVSFLNAEYIKGS